MKTTQHFLKAIRATFCTQISTCSTLHTTSTRHHTTKIGLMFTGQGSQFVGMGKQLYEKHKEAKEIFEEADQVLNYKLSTLMFEGDSNELTRTKNAQPAILTHSFALYTVSKKYKELDVGCALGHSLGEYTALVAAGAISFQDAVKLVRLRGEYMEECVVNEPHLMAALIPCSMEIGNEVCAQAQKETGKVCEVANINSDIQFVISGHKVAVERAIELAKKRKVKRTVILPVGAPFHCSLMKDAAKRLKPHLQATKWSEPRFPIISNVTAQMINSKEEIPILLEQQIYSPVRWSESIKYVDAMWKDQEYKLIEFGPKQTLCSLAQRSLPKPPATVAVENIDDSFEI